MAKTGGAGVRRTHAAPLTVHLMRETSSRYFHWLARDHCGENLDRIAWRRKVIVPRHFQHPIAKAIDQFLAPEEIVFAGREHVHVRRAFNQHIDNRAPAWPDTGLDVP